MTLLLQFVFRLAFGLAVGMAATSSRQVTSGYFRVHSYVLLGLGALAAVVSWPSDDSRNLAAPLLVGVLAYASAVAWLYEIPRAGKPLLVLIAVASIAGAWWSMPRAEARSIGVQLLAWLDPVTGGLVLGVTIAAMFLGHWYLNTPTMQLAPLRRLVLLMGASLAARALCCAAGLGMMLASGSEPRTDQVLFLVLRWAAGLVGALVLTWMTWQTLKVPNTQSATGILYVGVIATFLGELTSLLLSRGLMYRL
jgi:hypothetical protein